MRTRQERVATDIWRSLGCRTTPLVWFWFDFCFTALQCILGHFGRGQLTYPHCSWASLLGSLPVLSAHSFASNWQLLFLNQRKRENGRRNVFMTKSPRKNVPDVGIELGAACMPSGHASDRATAPELQHHWNTGAKENQQLNPGGPSNRQKSSGPNQLK